MAKDEHLYSHVLKEYESGVIDDDLFTKSLILSSGDKEAAKYQYVKLKVENIKSSNIKNMPLTAAAAARDAFKAVRDDRAESKRKYIEDREIEKRDKKARKERARRERSSSGIWPALTVILGFTAMLIIALLVS